MNPLHDPDNFAIKQEHHPHPSDSPRKRLYPFGHHAFSDHDSRSIRQKLDVALSRSETMQRPGPGGMRITYIEGWKVIHHANQIFGFNGWSSHIVSLDIRYIDETRGRFSACVSACVRITLRDGCTREDRGGGIAENMRSKGDAVLKAEKEAVTDATKRALKNFGLRLGLSLYDRQHVREMNRAPVHDPAKDVHTPVATRSAPSPANVSAPAPRYPQKSSAPSPITPSPQAFQKVNNATVVSSAASPTVSIDSELAAKVAANREVARRKQALHRARANQTPSPSAALAASAYQAVPQLQSDGVKQIAARHLNAVAKTLQRPSSANSASNALSAGLAASAAHPAGQLRVAANGGPPQRTNNAIHMQTHALSARQYALQSKRSYAMRGNMNAAVGNNQATPNDRQRAMSLNAAASSRTRHDPVLNVGLEVDANVFVEESVDSALKLALSASGDAGLTSMKQTEIDELSAIALADF